MARVDNSFYQEMPSSGCLNRLVASEICERARALDAEGQMKGSSFELFIYKGKISGEWQLVCGTFSLPFPRQIGKVIRVPDDLLL